MKKVKTQQEKLNQFYAEDVDLAERIIGNLSHLLDEGVNEQTSVVDFLNQLRDASEKYEEGN